MYSLHLCVYGNCTHLAVSAKIYTLHSLCKLLWRVSFRILFCISLKNAVMPHQVSFITTGPDQEEEDDFLVMAKYEYQGKESLTSGLEPSTQESAHPSFLPSHHPIVWDLSPFQMLLLHQSKWEQQGWGVPALHRPWVFFCSPRDVFLSTSAFSEEVHGFGQQFLILRIRVACREDVINSYSLCAGSSSLAVHTCSAHQEIPPPSFLM